MLGLRSGPELNGLQRREADAMDSLDELDSMDSLDSLDSLDCILRSPDAAGPGHAGRCTMATCLTGMDPAA